MDNTFKFCFSLLVALRVRKCVCFSDYQPIYWACYLWI